MIHFRLACAVATLLAAGLTPSFAQAKRQSGFPTTFPGSEKRIYKKVDAVELPLYIYSPEKDGENRPAVVFFFGGGWKSGSPGQFVEHCKYLASRGMVAVTADYRVSSKHDVQVQDCVEDARSAMRWVRAHADELGIDPDRIASGGGSAGGHLGACMGVVNGFDAAGEDTAVSAKSNAMVLFNPVMALAPRDELSDAYNEKMRGLSERIGVDAKEISPIEHVGAGLPPTIMFFGTDDGLMEGAERYREVAVEAGNRCELKTYEGVPHGFFNFNRFEGKYYRLTAADMDRFLGSLGWLEGEPTIGE